MNITLSFIINTSTYLTAVVIVLYHTFKDRIMKPVWKRLGLGLLAFLAVAVIGSIGFMNFGPGSNVQPFITLITSGCCFFIPYVVLEYNLGQCLFISGIVKCYADDVALLATVFYYFVSDRLPDSYLGFPAWPVVLITALSFPGILLFFTKLMRPALDCPEIQGSWSYTWLAPCLVNLMYALYMQPVFTEITSFPGKKFGFVPFLWVVLTFASYVIMLMALNGQSRARQLQEELHITDIRVTAQQKQLEHLQEYIEGTSKVRHDMRHHLLAMRGFAASGDYQKLTRYLNESISGMDRYDAAIYSGNAALDAILGYYRRMAEEAGIRVMLDVETDGDLLIPDTDMCIIMGNLLENAYEACMKQKSDSRYINTYLHQRGNVFIVVVENSYEGTVEKEDGDFLSSKVKNRKGIGIRSVIDVTKKYRGVPKFEYDGSRFKVSLLLNGNRK